MLIDSHLYERIVFNLLSNAVKFTPAGGKIRVSLQLEGDRLRLACQDTGIGIPEDAIKNLFQKFRQVDSAVTRRFEGAGLGLALVKEFIELLEGSVSVESKVGRGSTFTVECHAPRSATPVGEPVPSRSRVSLVEQYGLAFQAEEAPKEAGREKQLQEKEWKVLIVEDNAELALYISNLLSNLYQTKIARDGEEALQLVREWSPDLVLTDVMMPKRDGLSLLKEIKSNEATRAIPVVLLTALTYREALIRGWEAGADDYLFKPFHPKELMTRIQSFMGALDARRGREDVEAVKEEKIHDLEVLNKSMMNREERILELKNEVEELRAKLGGQA